MIPGVLPMIVVLEMAWDDAPDHARYLELGHGLGDLRCRVKPGARERTKPKKYAHPEIPPSVQVLGPHSAAGNVGDPAELRAWAERLLDAAALLEAAQEAWEAP